MRKKLKNLFFSLLSFVLGLGIIEGAAYFALRGLSFSPAIPNYAAHESLFTSPEVPPGVSGWPTDLLPRQRPHPYFGYVMSPWREPTNSDGFVNRVETPISRNSDEFHIGIFGGSVARQFCGYLQSEGAEKAQELFYNAWPELRGKKLKFINFSLDGGKQPQQQIISTYYIERLDMALNIDGFNEMVFGPAEQFPVDYPKHSWWLLNNNPFFFWADPGLSFSAWAFRWASAAGRAVPWLGRTNSYRLAWSALKKILMNNFNAGSLAERRELASKRTSPEQAKALASVWALNMKKQQMVQNAFGVPSFYFIQPNQYWGEKPMAEEERAIAYGDNWKEKSDLAKKFLAELKRVSVGEKTACLVSLVDLYETEKRPIFIDNCCHVNELGNELMLEKIVRKMKECRSRLALAPRVG